MAKKQQRATKTLADLEALFTATVNAQSVVLASILRAMIASDPLMAKDLRDSLDATDRAWHELGRAGAHAVLGLTALLRRDLGWLEGTGSGGEPPLHS